MRVRSGDTSDGHLPPHIQQLHARHLAVSVGHINQHAGDIPALEGVAKICGELGGIERRWRDEKEARAVHDEIRSLMKQWRIMRLSGFLSLKTAKEGRKAPLSIK